MDRDTNVVHLSVPEGYVLPHWFASASPSQTGAALDAAARLPLLAEEVVRQRTEKGDVDTQFPDAREEAAMRRLLGLVLGRDEARANRMQERCDALEASLREAATALSESRGEATRLRTSAATEAREEAAAALGEARRAQVDLADRVARQAEAAAAEAAVNAALRARVAELETPTSKGRAGELSVAAAAEAAGFQVEDTSCGEKKEEGYLDLLLVPAGEEAASSRCRIAVEVKNVATVEASSLRAFDKKVQRGIAAGKWDAAVFLSLRAHTKKERGAGGPVVLDLFPDAGGRPLAPVTWVGPERGREPPPLTSEQIETHLLMVRALVPQCERLRSDACGAIRDEDVSSLRRLVDEAGEQLGRTFTSLGRQHRLLDDMREALTEARVGAVRAFHAVWTANRSAPFLSRPLSASWMDAFQTASSKVEAGLEDAKVKQLLHRSKASLDRTVGQDAMLQAVREIGKRKREENGGDGGSPTGRDSES